MRVAYSNNLDNPNDITINSPSYFSHYTGPQIEVPGASVLILAQGVDEGFKRTIKVCLEFLSFGSYVGQKLELDLNNNMLVLNGIRDIES